MTTSSIAAPNSYNNAVDEWMNSIEREVAFFESKFPPEHPVIPVSVLCELIPRSVWDVGLWWQVEAKHQFDADMALGRAICDWFDGAQTVEQVDEREKLLLRWMEVARIDDVIDNLGKPYVSHRANERRDDILNHLPYPTYLESEHWQAVRHAALQRAGGRCQVCNSDKRLHVHHRSYERRGYELPEDVIVLCAACHKLFHDNRRLTR